MIVGVGDAPLPSHLTLSRPREPSNKHVNVENICVYDEAGCDDVAVGYNGSATLATNVAREKVLNASEVRRN